MAFVNFALCLFYFFSQEVQQNTTAGSGVIRSTRIVLSDYFFDKTVFLPLVRLLMLLLLYFWFTPKHRYIFFILAELILLNILCLFTSYILQL